VASTRAEKWLVVGGGGDVGKGPGDSWYNTIQAGLAHEASVPVEDDGMEITRYQVGDWPLTAPVSDKGDPPPAADLPGWARTHPALPDPAPRLIAPSDLGGAKALPGEGEDEATAKARGSFVHRLLEVLPDTAPDQRKSLAQTLFDASDPDLLGDPAPLIKEALAVLSNPSLAHVFADTTLAEVPITGPLSILGGAQAYGVIDRLIVWPDRVLAVDFKTNRQVPSDPDQTPEGVLRQMAAYAQMLGAVFPGRVIDMAILWTRTGELSPLCPQTLAAALGRAATS